MYVHTLRCRIRTLLQRLARNPLSNFTPKNIIFKSPIYRLKNNDLFHIAFFFALHETL